MFLVRNCLVGCCEKKILDRHSYNWSVLLNLGEDFVSIPNLWSSSCCCCKRNLTFLLDKKIKILTVAYPTFLAHFHNKRCLPFGNSELKKKINWRFHRPLRLPKPLDIRISFAGSLKPIKTQLLVIADLTANRLRKKQALESFLVQ